jgi:large subunit ribosomal protein L15
MAEQLNLSNLKPAAARKGRKRVGRGMGSGKGRYSGRGIKGQKSRSGSHKMRAGFEGGQMPIYMRLGKQRGPYSKDAMPVGPHRTHMASVNVRDLERFDAGAEITPQLLAQSGLIRNAKLEVKILGHGDLSKKLSVSAHGFSGTARDKIEGAGGSVTALKEPKVKRRRKKSAKPAPAAAPAAEAAADEAPAEAEAEAAQDTGAEAEADEAPAKES